MAGGDAAGLAQLVKQLAGDAREVAQAEVALQKARLFDKIARYKAAAIFFVIAGVLGLAALIAMLVGLILALATLLGPGWATLIVIGVTLGISAVLALVGKARLAAPAPVVIEAP